jgi:hypothetical protein
MTLYQYKTIQESEQATMLWEKAVFLGERSYDGHRILLYQIDGFYMKVFYNLKNNAIE